MKRNRQLITVALLAAATPSFLQAANLDTLPVPPEIDFLAHLDFDEVRASRTGAAYIEAFQKIDFTMGEVELPFEPVLALQGINSLTLFGPMPDLKAEDVRPSVVLLIRGTPEFLQVLRGVVSGIELENPGIFQRTAIGDQTIISCGDSQVFGSFLGDRQMAIATASGELETFLKVHAGRGPRLDVREKFPSYRMDDSGLFLGAFVEGIGAFENLPAQARILQLTQALSIQVGEFGEMLHLMASLVTDSPQTGQQVQDVLMGIVAMMTLTQTGQPDVAALVQSARVERVDRTVTLNLAYPAEQAIRWAPALATLLAENLEDKQAASESGAETPDVPADGESGSSSEGAGESPKPEGTPHPG